MTVFLDLPNELILYVLYHLDLPEYLAISLVHSRFHPLIKSSPYLQYRFASQVAGVTNNPYCDLITHKRSLILKDREDSWSQMTFDFETQISVGHASKLFLVTDGVCLVGDRSEAALHYFKLPSVADQPAIWNKFVLDEGLRVLDFDLAIYDNDLVAIATLRPSSTAPNIHFVEIQLLQFSTGHPHPQAHMPTLSVEETINLETIQISLQIAGQNISVATKIGEGDYFARLSVINWMTSTTQMTIAMPTLEIIFLSPTLLLVLNPRNAALDFYMIPSQTTISTDPIVPILSLSLPALEDTYHLDGLFCRSDLRIMPSVTPWSTKPFHTSEGHGILVIHMIVTNTRYFEHSFSMIVHRSSLVKLSSAIAEPPSKLPVTMEWETWGPSVTCWFETSGTDAIWTVVAEGQRCVMLERSDPDEHFDLMMLDFNPRNVGKLLDEQARKKAEDNEGDNDNDSEGGGVDQNEDYDYDQEKYQRFASVTDSWLSSPAFKDVVRSKLPNISISRRMDREFHGFLLDEERLINCVVSGLRYCLVDIRTNDEKRQ
ncbi:hypothetical protein C0991_005308 [Blastosporella zonata]|nr:hypothetical protein C0991_005308 [Blastosporella zonata]